MLGLYIKHSQLWLNLISPAPCQHPSSWMWLEKDLTTLAAIPWLLWSLSSSGPLVLHGYPSLFLWSIPNPEWLFVVFFSFLLLSSQVSAPSFLLQIYCNSEENLHTFHTYLHVWPYPPASLCYIRCIFVLLKEPPLVVHRSHSLSFTKDGTSLVFPPFPAASVFLSCLNQSHQHTNMLQHSPSQAHTRVLMHVHTHTPLFSTFPSSYHSVSLQQKYF